jgi:hypothetical protein
LRLAVSCAAPRALIIFPALFRTGFAPSEGFLEDINDLPFCDFRLSGESPVNQGAGSTDWTP